MGRVGARGLGASAAHLCKGASRSSGSGPLLVQWVAPAAPAHGGWGAGGEGLPTCLARISRMGCQLSEASVLLCT